MQIIKISAISNFRITPVNYVFSRENKIIKLHLKLILFKLGLKLKAFILFNRHFGQLILLLI